MMIEVILMVCLIMIQLMIGHLWHQIGWSYTKAILLMCLPLGIGLYLMQLFYYETRYTNWEVPFKTKLNLKYIYFNFVRIYFNLCLFFYVTR